MKSFWDRVAEELEYLGMTNKALADKVGITASNIGKGIKSNAMPSAENAVKIAHALNVSVEYLVTGSTGIKTSSGTGRGLPREYKKYLDLIEQCERLSPSQVKLLVQIAENFHGSGQSE